MSWTNVTKQPGDNSFLLKEDTFFLLLEDGFKIVLARAGGWANKAINSTSWSNKTIT